jgi:hypothetical protein
METKAYSTKESQTIRSQNEMEKNKKVNNNLV